MPIEIYWKFYHQKMKNFQVIFGYFSYFCSRIDCGYSLEPPRRGGSNEYPQSMFLSRNKWNNVYSCKPQFYYIKVGFKGVNIIKACFRDVLEQAASKEETMLPPSNVYLFTFPLRKHANLNTLRILPSKKWKFSDKKNLIFFMFLLKT